MKEILKFIDQYKFGPKEMIGFATWWWQTGPHIGPGPTSPDLKDWIEIEMHHDSFYDEWYIKRKGGM
jgi:hypothetical protein